MTKTFKTSDDYTVTYMDNQRIRDAVFDRVLKFFKDFEYLNGESIIFGALVIGCYFVIDKLWGKE